MSVVKISLAKAFSLQPSQPASDVLTASRFSFSSKPLIHSLTGVSSAEGPGSLDCQAAAGWSPRPPRGGIPSLSDTHGWGWRGHLGRRGRASQPCQISNQKCRWGGPGFATVRARARRAPSHSSGLLL